MRYGALTFSSLCVVSFTTQWVWPDSKYNHSRNFTGPILNFFCFNNGYHTQHHISPGLHWSLLPMRHKDIETSHSDDSMSFNGPVIGEKTQVHTHYFVRPV